MLIIILNKSPFKISKGMNRLTYKIIPCKGMIRIVDCANDGIQVFIDTYERVRSKEVPIEEEV